MKHQYFIDHLPPCAAPTGRVMDWLTDPTSRDPVSCTVYSVDDTMENNGIFTNSIEDSWIFTSHCLRSAAGVAIDLSNLRPNGRDNGRGLTSSGPASFAKVYSTINDIVRRGGVFKKGAVTIYLDYYHEDIEEFLNLPQEELPWAKRAVYISPNIKNFPEILELLANKVNKGIVWLAKKNYDAQHNRLYSNVCLEVLLRHQGSCLLHHNNLGLITELQQIPVVMVDNMKWLCDLKNFVPVNTKYYLPREEDNQVGLGVIGLANLLKNFNVTYEQFVNAYDSDSYSNTASLIWKYLKKGYREAAGIARTYGMERAFTIAPTASCSYRYRDNKGFNVTPEISPPVARETHRDSELFGVEYANYGGVEIASEVGWGIQWKLLNHWQDMMNSTGLAHSISANIWTDQHITPKWITDVFMPSRLQTTYYRLNVQQDVLDKSIVPGFLCAANDPQYCEPCGG